MDAEHNLDRIKYVMEINLVHLYKKYNIIWCLADWFNCISYVFRFWQENIPKLFKKKEKVQKKKEEL